MTDDQDPKSEQPSQNIPSQLESLFKVDNLAIDWSRRTVTVGGQLIELSPIEFEILAYLAQKAPQVVSPQELASNLYHYEAGAQEASAIIRTNIYRIRQKLQAGAVQKDVIHTVRGAGYRFESLEKKQESDSRIIDGRYRLLDLIGKGGTASVYKAYQESLDRYVAIKFLHPALPDETLLRERFRLEARHVASLTHPNIIQIYDFGNESGSYYIAMEFIEGQTLEEQLSELEARQQRLPLPQALQIIRETGRALAYAHRQGIIHRDVKPGNIMLGRDGRIVIMDFGLAKLVAAPHLTREGHISGTPDYMAPEQIQGFPLDTRVDIYGLGVVIYRLITGRLPFTAETEIAVLFQHVKEAPSLPSLLVADLPEGLEFITLKALAKQPDKRYQTMEEMLADLEEPEKVTGTIADVLPSLEAKKAPPPHYLPAPATPFMQRQQEVTAIQSKLMQPGMRLLTLVGVGGTGKTRLALEVAKNLLGNFVDGVFFVDLTTVQMPDLLPGAIARTTGMAEEGEKPIQQQLLAYLSKRQLLLVLDNFEHLLAAAPFISEILTEAPEVNVLATSREPLRLYGENLFNVAPLPLPDLRQQLSYEELRHYTAVQLFVSRAEAADPDFVLTPDNVRQVAELCVRLDGLPLALELAASQVYTFTLSELARQLSDRLAFLPDGPRDRSARQRTMRGAIDWSYELLAQEEQEAFSRLGIFAGRFSAAAAREIVGVSSLEGLAQKSLLQQGVGQDGRPRFWLLQVLREYALERLSSGEPLEKLQQKYTAYYLKLAETAEPYLTGAEQSAWFKRLEEAHDNFRALLNRSLKEDSPETALRLGSILWRLWAVYSYLSEGTLWLEEILAKTSAQTHSPVHYAKALFGAGRLAMFQQKLAQAEQYFQESLALYQALQDPIGQATLWNSLGKIALQQGALQQGAQERAGQLFNEALALFRAAGDTAGAVHTLNNLGQLAFYQGHYEQANTFLLEALELGEALGISETQAITLNGLGEIARIQMRYKAAVTFYNKTLELYKHLNYAMGQALVLHNLGQVKLAQKQFQEAKNFFRESLSLLRTMEEKLYVGWNLTGLGVAILNLGNPKHGVRLFSAAQALFQRFGGQLDAIDQVTYENWLAESKKQLPESEWQQAWLEGQAMPVENELLNIISLTPLFPQ